MISLSVQGMSEVLDFYNSIEDKMDSPFGGIEDKVSSLAVEDIKEKTPVSTGTLRDGTNSNTTKDNVEIYSDVEYAPFVDAKSPFFFLEEATQDEISETVLDNLIGEKI